MTKKITTCPKCGTSHQAIIDVLSTFDSKLREDLWKDVEYLRLQISDLREEVRELRATDLELEVRIPAVAIRPRRQEADDGK